MKNLLFIICISFFIAGCSLFSPAPNLENLYAKDGNYVATIKKFTISPNKIYTYYFTSKGANLKADSLKYYYKSGDIVSINVKNSTISSMFLLKREVSSSQTPMINNTPKEKIIRKKKATPSKISVPATQSVSF